MACVTPKMYKIIINDYLVSIQRNIIHPRGRNKLPSRWTFNRQMNSLKTNYFSYYFLSIRNHRLSTLLFRSSTDWIQMATTGPCCHCLRVSSFLIEWKLVSNVYASLAMDKWIIDDCTASTEQDNEYFNSELLCSDCVQRKTRKYDNIKFTLNYSQEFLVACAVHCMCTSTRARRTTFNLSAMNTTKVYEPPPEPDITN